MPRYPILLTALFASGAAGLVNQIAWQRAVKVYLANSEELSAMVVVLVFMLGLGVGSVVAARSASRWTSPFRVLGVVEVLLCLVNGVLLLAFGEELRELANTMQTAAVAAGIPTRMVYALLAFVVLVVPCFLMGLTIPLAAEGAQRQLDVSRARAVTHFFFVNTVGAVAGTLGGGLLLLPILGQKAALACAAGANLCAGLLILALLGSLPARAAPAETPEPAAPRPRGSWRKPRNEELLAFFLGALSLSYEVYLFRILALAYTPMPWIFSLVLCFYLLFWSVGVAWSERIPHATASALLATAVGVACVPFLLAYHRFHAPELPLWGAGLLYFLPCFGFGVLFGQTINRYAKSWGHDVGLFTALNTAGSCLGILVTTFVLFEIDKDIDAWILAAGLVVFLPYFWRWRGEAELPARMSPGVRNATLAAAAVLVLAVALGLGRAGPIRSKAFLELYGHDGVVEVSNDGRVYINGLWHSVLFRDDNAGAKRSENVRRKMLVALLPLLAHQGGGSKEVLNIGMGTGATARLLAKSSAVRSVDAYEIVTTLQDLLALYPEETLGTANLEKIDVRWQDARTGLIVNNKSYDIITQSPLYLNQSGSSFLLSREYLSLLKSRLKPGGVAGIYCNTMGNEAQALLVRQTVAEVFAYQESFANSYFILASDSPIDLSAERFGTGLAADDPVVADVALLGLDWIRGNFDRPRLVWQRTPHRITDDQPLVEYPALVDWLVAGP